MNPSLISRYIPDRHLVKLLVGLTGKIPSLKSITE